jgi:hypothetical protein
LGRRSTVGVLPRSDLGSPSAVAGVNRFVLRALTVAKKKKSGRAPATLTKRFVMRCTPHEFARWSRHAKDLGMSGVAPLVRKATNDALTAVAG